MKLVSNKQDLLENIKRIDEYIRSENNLEYDFALSLIRKGVCFIALFDADTIKFYPSRFIGYKDNNMEAHLSNESKDGRVTNPQISSIIDKSKQPRYDYFLDQMYIEYCNKLGFIALSRGTFGIQRKYWAVHRGDFDK